MGSVLPIYKPTVIGHFLNLWRMNAPMIPPITAFVKKTRFITSDPNQLTPEITSHNILQMMPVQIPHKVEAIITLLVDSIIINCQLLNFPRSSRDIVTFVTL